MQYRGSEELERVWRGILAATPPEERLEGLSAEERLKGLSAEERLKGLSVEERLRGLSAEELELAAVAAKACQGKRVFAPVRRIQPEMK